jgi:hypothetical protein
VWRFGLLRGNVRLDFIADGSIDEDDKAMGQMVNDQVIKDNMSAKYLLSNGFTVENSGRGHIRVWCFKK